MLNKINKINKDVALLCIVITLFWFSLYSYVPIILPYAELLGASVTLMGLIGGAYGFSQMLARIPLGFYSDKLNVRKLFICAGLIISILSGGIAFLFPSPVVLLISRFGYGLAASTWVGYSVLFASYYKPEEAQKAIGFVTTFNVLGVLSGQLFGSIIAQKLGNNYSFLLALIAGFIAFCLSLFIRENKKEVKDPMNIKKFVKVISTKSLLFVSSLAILSQTMAFATATGGFTYVIAANKLGATSLQLGFLSFAFSSPGIILAPLSGTFFKEKFGSRNTLMFAFAIFSLYAVSVPFAPSFGVLLALQVLGACGSALIMPTLMGLSIKDFEQDLRGSAMGIFQAIYGLGMFLGPVIFGIISDNSSLTVGFIFIGLIGAFSILTIFIKYNNILIKDRK